MDRRTAPDRLADELARGRPAGPRVASSGKLGLGSAIVAGFRKAIADGYDFVINMDADFSHDPSYLPALLECMIGADVAIGSPLCAGRRSRGLGSVYGIS